MYSIKHMIVVVGTVSGKNSINSTNGVKKRPINRLVVVKLSKKRLVLLRSLNMLPNSQYTPRCNRKYMVQIAMHISIIGIMSLLFSICNPKMIWYRNIPSVMNVSVCSDNRSWFSLIVLSPKRLPLLWVLNSDVNT